MPLSFSDLLRLYDFRLPPHLVAQAPAVPRDSARLLVYQRASGVVSDAVFRDIGKYLPRDAVLVLNRTKVVPARLMLSRTTGGVVSVLSLGRMGGSIKALANRRLRVGEELTLSGSLRFTVERSEDRFWHLKPSFPPEEFENVLEQHGNMPLPPYIKESPLSEEELRREYQSVIARDAGSIAAPTASLHFTEELLAGLRRQGVQLEEVTLHVHLGTFAPLAEEQWSKGSLHTESYRIDSLTAQRLLAAKEEGRPIIAVGTTVVRTLESAADASGILTNLEGSTDIFIREGSKLRFVDGLVTNFHVPRSSLLMLVAALVGREKLFELYSRAISKEYRFYSFGDAMLII